MCYVSQKKPRKASCKSRLVLNFKGWLLTHQKAKDRSFPKRKKHVQKEGGVTEGVSPLLQSH